MSISWEGTSSRSGQSSGVTRSDPHQSESRDETALSLVQLIECEIVPRLLLAHRDGVADRPGSQAPVGESKHNDEAIAAFAAKAITDDRDALLSDVRRWLDSGQSLESVLLFLLAPTARLLGQWWEEDRCSFADVTVGVSKLHQLLHALCGRSETEVVNFGPQRRALFAAAPGEQHVFGLAMMERLFQRDGWDTSNTQTMGEAGVGRILHDRHVDMLGLSVANDFLLDSLAGVIDNARRMSRNRKLIVLVGGRIFLDRIAQYHDFGADGTASDGVAALALANSLVPRSTGVVRA